MVYVRNRDAPSTQNVNKLAAKRVCQTRLDLSNLALQLLNNLVRPQRLNLQSVQPAGRAELQLHSLLKPLNRTKLRFGTQSHKLVNIRDFSWHAFYPQPLFRDNPQVFICYGTHPTSPAWLNQCDKQP